MCGVSHAGEALALCGPLNPTAGGGGTEPREASRSDPQTALTLAENALLGVPVSCCVWIWVWGGAGPESLQSLLAGDGRAPQW